MAEVDGSPASATFAGKAARAAVADARFRNLLRVYLSGPVVSGMVLALSFSLNKLVAHFEQKTASNYEAR